MCLRAVHVGEQDVVPVCPVDPAVDVVDRESRWSVCVCINKHSWVAAVHPHSADVWMLTAVDPKNIPIKKNKRHQSLDSALLWSCPGHVFLT